MKKITVFCLPYAGGSKSIYNEWMDRYSSIAEIVPIEYSGHGSLYGYDLIDTAEASAEFICEKICRYIPDDYIIYGHSLGSLIGWLTAVKLQEQYHSKPKAVIIGGLRPPHLFYKDRKILGLNKDEFMKKIFNMGQTPDIVFETQELVEFLYDIFYNDVKIHEEYKYNPDIPKLSMPLAVMLGKNDPDTSMEDLMEWSDYCADKFYIKEFEANHFFSFNCNEFEPYFKELILLFTDEKIKQLCN